MLNELNANYLPFENTGPSERVIARDQEREGGEKESFRDNSIATVI